MPSFGALNVLFGPMCSRRARAQGFRPTLRGTRTYTLSGVSKDASGLPLGTCTVDLFNAGDNSWVARTVSDVLGAFTFTGIGAGPFFLRAVNAAGTVAGTTLGALTAS